MPGKGERFVESSVDPELLRVTKARISAQMVFSLNSQISLPSFLHSVLFELCYQDLPSCQEPGDLAFSRCLARCEVLPCGFGGGSWNFDAVYSIFLCPLACCDKLHPHPRSFPNSLKSSRCISTNYTFKSAHFLN